MANMNKGCVKIPFSERLKNYRVASSGCHEWQGQKNEKGYGYISTHWNGKKKRYRAHRVAYEEYVGPIPGGHMVCHHCDNPSCINPEHLFTGTNQDNVDDRNRKGRTARGEAAGQTKISALQAATIKYYTGISAAELGGYFGVSDTQAIDIRNGKKWGHI